MIKNVLFFDKNDRVWSIIYQKQVNPYFESDVTHERFDQNFQDSAESRVSRISKISRNSKISNHHSAEKSSKNLQNPENFQSKNHYRRSSEKFGSDRQNRSLSNNHKGTDLKSNIAL